MAPATREASDPDEGWEEAQQLLGDQRAAALGELERMKDELLKVDRVGHALNNIITVLASFTTPAEAVCSVIDGGSGMGPEVRVVPGEGGPNGVRWGTVASRAALTDEPLPPHLPG